MKDRVQTFWLEPTEYETSAVHGYSDGLDQCPKRKDGVACVTARRFVTHGVKPLAMPEVPADMLANPVCETCGRVIPDVSWSKGTHLLYRLPAVKTWDEDWPGGTMIPLSVAPVGAMWDAHWLKGDEGRDLGYTGPDGIALCVKLPSGTDWLVDSQASNCPRDQYEPDKEDARCRRFNRTHYCWIRTGDPRTGRVDVTKGADPAQTCAAGAGSIWVNQGRPNEWHGFLHRGVLHR